MAARPWILLTIGIGGRKSEPTAAAAGKGLPRRGTWREQQPLRALQPSTRAHGRGEASTQRTWPGRGEHSVRMAGARQAPSSHGRGEASTQRAWPGRGEHPARRFMVWSRTIAKYVATLPIEFKLFQNNFASNF